jgi:hypothetical protein
MWHLGQHTLLGIVVGLCGVLLVLVYEGPLTTHFTGYCCGLCEVSGNTLLGIIRADVGRLHEWVQNNLKKK